MSEITIYDSQGKTYSPDGRSEKTNQEISKLSLASLRIGVDPDEGRIVGYVKAKETETSRAEQYYAEYVDRSTSRPLRDFVDAVKSKFQDWGYLVETKADEMSAFRAIDRNEHAELPGNDNDRSVLEELAKSREVTTVGVSGSTEAIRLMRNLPDHHSVAITDSEDTDALSKYDVAIITGRYRGIKPLGDTTERWEKEKEAQRDKLIQEEIDNVKSSVRTLKRDFGLSTDEIKQKVPELSSSGSTSASRGSFGSQSRVDKIKYSLANLSGEDIGKYVFIVSTILLLLIGGAFAAGQFGVGPFSGNSTQDQANETSGGVGLPDISIPDGIPIIGDSGDDSPGNETDDDSPRNETDGGNTI